MSTPNSLYNIPLTTIDGKPATLKPYQGQVILIVNVASRCGFTPQYKKLQALHKEFHDQGFSVLGFPCDQFLHQEPGSNQEIKAFADDCFRVTFPLFSKINVKKGPDQSPLYAYLSKHIETWNLIFIPWNFTKILVDSNGRVLKRFYPFTSFKTIRNHITKLLTKK